MVRAATSNCCSVEHGVLSWGMTNLADDLDNRSCEIVKHCADVLARERAGVLESYLQGNVEIVLRRIDVGGRHYGLVFKACPSRGENESLVDDLGCDTKTRRQRGNVDQAPVLPLNVQCVEGPQGIIPSVPRLQLLNSRLIRVGQKLYLFTSRVLTREKRALILANGELGIFWTRVAISDSQPVGQQVKGASDAVEDCSRLGVEDCGEFFGDLEPNQFFANLRVIVSYEGVRATLAPGFGMKTEGFELGYGPVNSGLGV